jgi:hypothetical protein
LVYHRHLLLHHGFIPVDLLDMFFSSLSLFSFPSIFWY